MTYCACIPKKMQKCTFESHELTCTISKLVVIVGVVNVSECSKRASHLIIIKVTHNIFCNN